jgi:hypothetical protein
MDPTFRDGPLKSFSPCDGTTIMFGDASANATQGAALHRRAPGFARLIAASSFGIEIGPS